MPDLTWYTDREFVFDFADSYKEIPLPEGDAMPKFTPSEIPLTGTRYVKIEGSELWYSVSWEESDTTDNPLNERAVDACFDYEQGNTDDSSFLGEMQYLARLQRMMDAGVVVDATLNIEVGVMIEERFISLLGDFYTYLIFTQDENGEIVPLEEDYFNIDDHVEVIIRIGNDDNIEYEQGERMEEIKRLLDEYAAVERARRSLLVNED